MAKLFFCAPFSLSKSQKAGTKPRKYGGAAAPALPLPDLPEPVCVQSVAALPPLAPAPQSSNAVSMSSAESAHKGMKGKRKKE
jgi:hypothetical protein